MEMEHSSCSSEEAERSSCSSEETLQSSCGSDVLIIDSLGIQAVNPVFPKNVNIVNSKRTIFGPQFVTVTQNVEKVKDLPFHRYMWNLARNSSKSEKALCGGVTLVLIVCILLTIYFSLINRKLNDSSQIDSDGWFVNKNEWLAIPYNKTENTSDQLRLVIISHTTGPPCNTLIDCIMTVKNLQKYYIHSIGYNIPYNFLIGGDGRVYEGRGWNVQGAHTLGYNTCSMGLAFIGDYREGLQSYTNVTSLQQERAHMLFEEGVKNGHLHSHFHVLGAMDLKPTSESPGTNLYNAIRKWPNYDHQNLYKGKNCSQIQELFEPDNVGSSVDVA